MRDLVRDPVVRGRSRTEAASLSRSTHGQFINSTQIFSEKKIYQFSKSLSSNFDSSQTIKSLIQIIRWKIKNSTQIFSEKKIYQFSMSLSSNFDSSQVIKSLIQIIRWKIKNSTQIFSEKKIYQFSMSLSSNFDSSQIIKSLIQIIRWKIKKKRKNSNMITNAFFRIIFFSARRRFLKKLFSQNVEFDIFKWTSVAEYEN